MAPLSLISALAVVLVAVGAGPAQARRGSVEDPVAAIDDLLGTPVKHKPKIPKGPPAAAGPAQAGEAPAKRTSRQAAATKAAPAPKAAVRPAEVALSTTPITVVWPEEQQRLPNAPSYRILGAVSHPKRALRINGTAVKPHRNGAYIAYLPVAPGSFTFRCELDLPSGATSFARTIVVAPPPFVFPPGQARVDADSIEPTQNLELWTGDWLTVQAKGTPGHSAEFQFQSRKTRHPMAESSPGSGLYQGAVLFQPGETLEDALVYVHLKKNGQAVTAAARGRVTVKAPAPGTALIKPGAQVALRTGPGTGYMIFPPAGTKVLTATRLGEQVRIMLNPTLSGWTNAASLQPLPAGTPPPKGVLSTMRTEYAPDSTTVYLGLKDTVPFLVDAADDLGSLTVRLFHTVGDTDWIVYDTTDTFVRQISWRQETSDTAAVTVRFDPQKRLWGWQASWQSGALKVELRHPPKSPPKGSPLAGRTIILDPGHMPSAPGAIGPKGTYEKDVNLAIAKALEKLLLKEGAKPVLTRAGDDEVSLVDRPRIAWENRGDAFVSLHNNNLPDKGDPFERQHGFSVFYYHPQSLELARAVHRAYMRRIPLPEENLRYGNLHVARTTEMPAILVESAYMTYPEQEELLNTPSFQRRLAGAVLEGLRDFFESQRRRAGGRP